MKGDREEGDSSRQRGGMGRREQGEETCHSAVGSQAGPRGRNPSINEGDHTEGQWVVSPRTVNTAPPALCGLEGGMEKAHPPLPKSRSLLAVAQSYLLSNSCLCGTFSVISFLPFFFD